MTSWDEIRGKIKHAYDDIESAYEKHVVSAVDKVKERPALNTAVKTALPFIPIIGPTLSALYDNIGGGTRSEEDKAKQILEFLKQLEQQNEEQFDRIAQNLETYRHAIIDAINENKITITDLITNSSKEILDAVYDVQKTADATLDKVEAISGGVERMRAILEQRRPATSELKRPSKPSIFHGESKIFVGRAEDIDTIKNYFLESCLPVSITGEGGIGKSALAYKAMRKCDNMFDLIIPIYFGSHLTFGSFLLELANSLNLPINEFEKRGLEERRQMVMDTLGQGEFKHPLIYADNYETIARVLRTYDRSASTKEKEEEIDNARRINGFLEHLPANTAILLTSRERNNLDLERPVRLDGLSETEGRKLFIELAKNHFPKGEEPSAEIKRVLEEISKKTGGHPLSIELLARSYRGKGLSKIREMLEHLGIGVVNPKEETERLRSLESCFEYSFNILPQTHRDLLPTLTLFNSPFPADAIEKIFGIEGSRILLDLYDHSLLRRIEFDENNGVDVVDANFYLYYFHPAIRNYLERKAVEGRIVQGLEEKYNGQFSQYYLRFLHQTYNAPNTKVRILSFELFNVIWQGKDNDLDRAIRLSKDGLIAGYISSYLGLILHTLGMYLAAFEYFKKALAIDEELQDRAEIAKDYCNIGVILLEQGEHIQALEYHKKALMIHEELQDKVGIALDYRNLGLALNSQGKYEEAMSYHKKALMIHEELQDKVGMAGDYGNIGIVLERQGNYQESLKYHGNALAIDEELQDKVGIALDYRNIGNVLDIHGNHIQALEYHKKALMIHEELQDKVGMAGDYAGIGVALLSKGNHDEALEYHNKALAIHEERQEIVGMATDYRNIGLVFQLQGKYEEAMSYHKKALMIHEELQDKVGMAGDYGNIGFVFFGKGNHDEALEHHNKALAIHEELQDKVGMARDYGKIGFVFANTKNRKADAIESFSKGLEILEELQERTGYHHPFMDTIRGYITQLQD